MQHIAQMIDRLAVGGAERLQVIFAQVARQRNLRLTVISLRDDQHTPIPAELRALGVQLVTFAAHDALDMARFMRVYSFVRRERFDVLHTHLATSNILGALAGRLTGTPVVASLHNMFQQRPKHPGRQAIETQILRRLTNKVVAVGHVVGETHQQRLAGTPITVVPNAVLPPPPLPPAERTALRQAVSGDPERPLLLAVGRLVPQKGFDDLLNVFALLRQTHPQVALAIAGTGPLAAPLAARVAALGLDGHVHLLGQRGDVLHLMGAADLFVSSSHWEGLPVSILEAMASGLPIVATSVGEAPRLLGGGAGVLVAPHEPGALVDALRAALDDGAYRQSLAAAARRQVAEHYSAEGWVDRLLAVYAEAAARPGNSSRLQEGIR